jgi:hypothetical protein
MAQGRTPQTKTKRAKAAQSGIVLDSLVGGVFELFTISFPLGV